MPTIRAVLKSACGVVFTLGLSMASVEPDAVTSNLAKWWSVAAGEAPLWLANPWADIVIQALCLVGLIALAASIGWNFYTRKKKKTVAAQTTAGSATIMLEQVRLPPPETFPSSGEVYDFDFFPRHIFSGPRRGKPGDSIRWGFKAKDGFEIFGPGEAMRLTLVSKEPIFQVAFKIKAEFKETVRSDNGGTRSGDLKHTEEFLFGFARMVPDQPIDLWLHTQVVDTVFLDLPKEEIAYTDPSSGGRVKAKLIFQLMYGGAVLDPANPSGFPLPQ